MEVLDGSPVSEGPGPVRGFEAVGLRVAGPYAAVLGRVSHALIMGQAA
jgi:hypothetical protein